MEARIDGTWRKTYRLGGSGFFRDRDKANGSKSEAFCDGIAREESSTTSPDGSVKAL